MRARIWIAAVLALLLSGLAVVSFTPPAQAEDSWIEWQILGYVNRSRAGAGLPPLSMSRDVQGIARGWSDYLAATGSLWHNPNAWGQIASVAPSWTAMGENVGWGWNTADIHNALMASSVHRNQILGSYNNVGIGVTVRNGKIYVTEDFVRTSGSLSAASAPNFSVTSDGDLVRNPVGGAVYLVEGGAKFWFRDAASFWNAGYSWSSVRDLSPTFLNAVPSIPRDPAPSLHREATSGSSSSKPVPSSGSPAPTSSGPWVVTPMRVPSCHRVHSPRSPMCLVTDRSSRSGATRGSS